MHRPNGQPAQPVALAIDFPEHRIGRLDQSFEIAPVARWNGECPHISDGTSS